MAVNDYPGADPTNYPDWLQALMGNTGPSPQGYAPGGSLTGVTASSGGGPNMGYPAAGGGMSANVPSPLRTGVYGSQTTAPPAAQPQSGFWSWLKNIGSGPAISPNGVMASGSTMSSPAPPAAQGYDPLSSIRPPVNGPLATPYRPEDSPSAGPVVNEPSIAARTPAAVSPNAIANAPLPPVRPAAPAAVSPAATASVPAAAPSRFTWIDRPNMSANAGARGGGGPPGMTALNLAGLFGGGQPQAPAGVNPAATARVPGPLASRGPPISPTTGQPMPMSSDDMAYGLPDARGAPYPYAIGSPRRSAALAAAGRRSGYQ
jgi:hypothetical protein